MYRHPDPSSVHCSEPGIDPYIAMFEFFLL
jgi:hypothetical protein